MINDERITVMTEIMRFCSLSRDETRIRSRFGLNSVQADAYLTILKQRKMLTLNNGKYQITDRGKTFLTSCDKINGVKTRTA
jgi:predicted transcriptional regulator